MSNSMTRMRPGAEWGEAVLQSLTAEMVADLAAKLASALESADELLKPETLALLRSLSDASESLSNVLAEVRRLEESGTLKSLAELGELLAGMKGALTGPMVADLMEQGVRLLEWADLLGQRDVRERMTGLLAALESAREESRKADAPLTLFRMFRALSDPEVREGIRFFLAFARALPRKL